MARGLHEVSLSRIHHFKRKGEEKNRNTHIKKTEQVSLQQQKFKQLYYDFMHKCVCLCMLRGYNNSTTASISGIVPPCSWSSSHCMFSQLLQLYVPMNGDIIQQKSRNVDDDSILIPITNNVIGNVVVFILKKSYFIGALLI